MERNIILLTLLWAGINSSVAQRTYVEAFGTWQLPEGGETMAYRPSTGDPYISETLNFGAGFGAGLVVGHALSDHLAVELRATRMRGKKELTSNNVDEFSNQSSTSTFTSKHIRLEPALRLRTGDEGLNLHVAVGPTFLIGSELAMEQATTSSYSYPGIPMDPSTNSSTATTTYTGGMAMGGFGALGISYRTRGAVGLFAEVNFTSLSWSPREAGVEAKSSYTFAGDTEYESESYTVSFEEELDSSVDKTKDLRFSLPYSTWGVRAGLTFTFGPGESKTPAGDS